MKPYPNEELDRMSKREIIRLYKRTVKQFNDAVPVVHGKWDKGTDSNWHICEECGAEVDISMGTGVWVEGVELYELKYCPYCGAKMDAQEKDDDRKTD